MGFRFRKQIKIAPGIKLNINKNSTSISVGGKGFTHTVNTTGKTTSTVGIPGTGLSYSATSSATTDAPKEPKADPVPVRDLEHLDENGELPLGWHSANRQLTQPVELVFAYLRDKYTEEKHKGVLAKYASLRAFVLYMDDMYESCASKGECFVKWSYDLASPAYVDSYKSDLAFMEQNMEHLLNKEKIIKQLKTDLLEIIKAEPGVVQTELYKRFDAELKDDVSNELYWLARKGLIEREKSGRSYKLFISDVVESNK